MKLALLEPAAIVTLAGTFAPVDDESVTDEPPGPAAPVSVTVPIAELPPTSALGETPTVESVAGLIVSVAVLLVPFKAPVMVTVAPLDTALVVTVNVAVVEPPATVTDAGSVALELLEVSETDSPPVPAAALSVTVPIVGFPPCTDAGDSVTLVKLAAVMLRVAAF